MPTLTATDRTLYAARLAAFLDQHDKSVELLTDGLAQSPDEPRLLRHRGHRRITLRDFPGALDDLSRAAQLIDGRPDEHEFYQADVVPDLYQLVLGNDEDVREPHIPVNEETNQQFTGMYKATLNGSVWYHKGIAHYLLGDFRLAHDAFAAAATTAADDDLAVAIVDWRYMSLRRADRVDEAAELLETVRPSEFAGVNSTHDFYLRRLRMYTGEIDPDELLRDNGGSYLAVATQGYGVGNWYLYNGSPERAEEVFREVLQHGFRNAFGFIAAERDLELLAARPAAEPALP